MTSRKSTKVRTIRSPRYATQGNSPSHSSPRETIFGSGTTTTTKTKRRARNQTHKLRTQALRSKITNPTLQTSSTAKLTPSQLRTRRAAAALARLQKPVEKHGALVWDKDAFTEIVDANLGILFHASLSTEQEQQVKDSHETWREREAVERAKWRRHPENRGRGSWGRERKRRFDDYDEDEEEDEREEEDGPKRIKPSQVVKTHLPVDLEKLAPQPIQVMYRPHPLTDRDDEWFEEMFRRLYRQAEAFSRTFFGVHDLDKGEFFEPWGCGVRREFMAWVEAVVDAGNGTHEEGGVGWDEVLRDGELRVWLVMAVVVRVLRVKVFDTHLFGSEGVQGDLLLGIERALLTREGFQRTELRATTVRTLLGRSPLPPNFYPSVASLTAQISLLLKPLSDYLYAIPPSKPEQTLPAISQQYQALHNLVSTAAHLSICIRLSPTIFYFTDTSLGAAFDPEDQHNISAEHYTASKTAKHESFERERKEWQRALTAAEKTSRRHDRKGTQGTKAGKKAKAEYIRLYQSATPTLAQTHRPFPLISVWPCITRYSPGSEAEQKAENPKPLEKRDGFRIMQISKSAIVSYFGKVDRTQKIGLRRFLRLKEEEKGKGAEVGVGVGGFGKVVGTLAAVSGTAWFYRDLVLDKLGVDIEGGLASIVSEVIERLG